MYTYAHTHSHVGMYMHPCRHTYTWMNTGMRSVGRVICIKNSCVQSVCQKFTYLIMSGMAKVGDSRRGCCPPLALPPV